MCWKHKRSLHLSSKQTNESVQISNYVPSGNSVEIYVEKYSNPFDKFSKPVNLFHRFIHDTEILSQILGYMLLDICGSQQLWPHQQMVGLDAKLC